jgi:hypothetical protein
MLPTGVLKGGVGGVGGVGIGEGGIGGGGRGGGGANGTTTTTRVNVTSTAISSFASASLLRFERKLMMSQDEIGTIIHMQYAQLHSNHPYTDDYYYYQLQKRRGSQPLAPGDEPPDIIHHHKPLCESTPTRTFPPKKIINDPLAGSLGRIPSHNVRYVAWATNQSSIREFLLLFYFLLTEHRVLSCN